jgi:Tfp pilus assembly protein PilF
MAMRAVLIAALAIVGPLRAGNEDLMELPAGLRNHFSVVVARQKGGVPDKCQAVLADLFEAQEKGGLGIVYDNAHTRTITEVWTDRKANCLSLTLLFVGVCKSLGIKVMCAEALNTNRWSRVGDVVHLEHHMVALIPHPPEGDLVADFLPRLHKRWGSYVVTPLSEPRIRALFHSNRAVELLGTGDLEAAMAQARLSLAQDTRSSIGWNVQGVVLQTMGEHGKAEQAFREALALDAKDGAAIGNLELLLARTGREEEARRYRELGQKIRRKDPYYNAFLAEEAFSTGKLDEAGKFIATAIRIQPFESEFFLMQARLLLAQGRMEESLAAMEQAQRWAKPGERERYDSKLELLRRKQREKP